MSRKMSKELASIYHSATERISEVIDKNERDLKQYHDHAQYHVEMKLLIDFAVAVDEIYFPYEYGKCEGENNE